MRNTNQQIALKQRIRKIRTQHDQSANIDDELILEQTKKLHKDQIFYAQYVDKVTDRLFPLKPLQIGFVQSLTLKDDPKFKQIRHLLQKYNEQVHQYNQKSAPGLHLKTVVMDSMLKFMRLMLQAPDSTAKKRILDVAYYWFKKNLDASKKQKKSKQSLEIQVKNILLQNRLLPKGLIQKQLPSEKQKQELYHYKIQARTKYSQLDAPSTQLQNYITHKLGFAHQNQKNNFQSQNLNNKNKEQLREQKWKKRIIFKKPFIQQPNYSDIEQEQEQNIRLEEGNVLKERIDNNGQIQTKVQIKQRINTGEVVIGQPNANDNQQMQEKQITQQNENQAAMEQFGMAADEGQDPQQQQQQPEEENKHKKGKLDPLVKIFLLDRSKRIKTEGQISAENKYQFKRNKKLQQNRMDQLNKQFMSQWAGTRSRFKSELSRKIQSIRVFSSISKAKQEVSNNSLRVEHKINQNRLNQTLKQCQIYLHKEPVRQQLNTQKSMSLYDRKRIKTQATSSWKPFSTVLEDRKRLDQKTEYLDQIQQLKQKFAKYKLFTPLDSFKKAIMHPQEKDCIWSELDKVTNQKIQLPRSQMISNPFAKFGKKKKGKGKKRR